MSAWEGTRLETILRAGGRDVIINTGAWTNMSVEHTARTGGRQGLLRDRAGGLLLDHERRLAQCGAMVMAASTAATGRLKNGRMLPSDLMSEVTKLCSTIVPMTMPSTIAATG